jgi:hypothetical protein
VLVAVPRAEERFVGNRSEHCRGVGFVKFVDNDLIRDCLFQRFEDGGIDRSYHGSTFVAFEHDLFPVQFRHDGANTIDASASMGNDGKCGGSAGTIHGSAGWRIWLAARCAFRCRVFGRVFARWTG